MQSQCWQIDFDWSEISTQERRETKREAEHKNKQTRREQTDSNNCFSNKQKFD